jgi:hypothetical protein
MGWQSYFLHNGLFYYYQPAYRNDKMNEEMSRHG